MSDDTARRLPLSGVRILAQAIVWAGPFGSMILADLGADVIEIESIQHMSMTRGQMRHIPPSMLDGPNGAALYNRDPSEGFWNRGATFNFAKRGHRSVTIDLTRDEGRELFDGLIREADVFMENNAADVVGNLHIGWPHLSSLNPRLIMIRFPGFGIDGPYRDFKGFGATMEAIVGHSYLRGYRDSDPSATPAIYHGDPNAGSTAAFAIQAALFARERTGKGQLIDLSQAEAVIHHTSYSLMDYLVNGRVHEPWGNRHPWMAPYGIFPCRGQNRWLALAIHTDEAFAALCREMGQPQLASDARFATASIRYANQDALEELVAGWTREHEDRELMQRLQAAGVIAAMVYPQPEMFGDPHLQARGFFMELEHPEVPRRRYPAPMAHFEELPLLPVRGPAPTLGQHNREVLQGILGLTDQQYQTVLDTGLAGTAYLDEVT